MPLQWHQPTETETFDPRLDPVSAWLFARQSAFLRSADSSSDAAMLYAMGIDAAGFDPAVQDAWRAMSIPNPVTQGSVPGHPFSIENLDSPIGSQTHEIPNPGIFVLPLPEGGARDPETLRSNRGIGVPDLDRPHPSAPVPQAIIGIIDHGINIFHQRFQNDVHGSRVAFAWMQGQAQQDGARIRFGREWTKQQIDAAASASGGDEDTMLRQLGVDFETPGFRPLGFRSSHGTHLLDIAAGLDPADETGAETLIIAVTLPPEVTRETSGSMLAVPFALGLEYIADRARWIMRGHDAVIPVFVNFSFGLSGGPRDGQHRLERTIHNVAAHHQAEVTRLVADQEAPLTVAIAAGNNNLAQGHARSAAGASVLDLNWQIQPADRTANFLELRVEKSPAQEGTDLSCTLSVTPPGYTTSIDAQLSLPRDGLLDAVRFLRDGDRAIAQVTVVEQANNTTVLTLAIAATDPGEGAGPAAPAGTWGISLSCDGPTPARIDAWILRDDVPGGFRDTGRQSYFVDPNYHPFDARGVPLQSDTPDSDATVRRAGTLNALATGTASATRIVVAGVTGPPDDIRDAGYSATPLDDTPEAVDIAAFSDRSPVRKGIIAAGTRSGSRVALSGTSVAAPQVIRHLAMGNGTQIDAPETTRAAAPVVLPPEG